MKRLLALSCALFAFSAATLNVTPLAHAAEAAVEPFPVEYWAVRDQISNVSISPDGKKLAFMKIASRAGNPVIEIRDVSNLAGDPYTVGGKNMEITSFSWVSANDMIVEFRDQVSNKIDGFNQGAYKGKVAHFDVRTKKFTDYSVESRRKVRFVEFINALPDEPDHILVRIYEYARDSKNSGLESDYHKLNMRNQKKSLVLSGETEYENIRFDKDGNPRFAVQSVGNDWVYYHRDPAATEWKEYYRLPQSSFEEFTYGGVVDGDPDRIYVIANNGHDRAGLWKFNVRTKAFEDLVYRDDKVDVWGTVRHSNTWGKPGLVTGVSTFKDKFHYKMFDPAEEAILNRFKSSIANAGLVRITSRSKDGQVMIVSNISDRDPGTFYLYDAGSSKFMKIGSTNGLLKAEGLSEVRYITYPARDGKTIPGFLTVPNGDGPHPLVVMPHGGPFVREVVLFDDWAQMLANNGYMVLQPQYRGSQGYGIDFYTTAFMEGGEGGYKMQDDKDDGVKYLISQGQVDKDKVAFFGWSYGGYAALIAAARQPNLYNCAIAGAAVADNFQQINYYRSFLDKESAQGLEQLNFWTDSVNPIDEVENVNIPLLVIHGTIDQRVPVKHAKKYVDKLKSKKIPHKYIKLKDADHFSNTLFYDHKMEFYPAMLDFLKNDCGM
ncbi:MAG: S9 family peptidase [Hellea sp.]|nr:S9 family peptidase [Hellea sp.]